MVNNIGEILLKNSNGQKYWGEGAVLAWGVLVDSIGEILSKSSIDQEYWGVSAVLAWGSIYMGQVQVH